MGEPPGDHDDHAALGRDRAVPGEEIDGSAGVDAAARVDERQGARLWPIRRRGFTPGSA